METLFTVDLMIHLAIALVAIIIFISANAIVLVYAERKVAGFIQRRPGPDEVGPYGLLQPFADAVKLVAKQLVRPRSSDSILFWLAPIITFAPLVLMFMPIPFSPLLTGYSIELGLFMILALSGMHVLAVLLAGWGSNSKYSLYGAARGVSQSVAYEIPLLLAVLAIVIQHGSLNLSTIVDAQGSWPWQWGAFKHPIAFLIFFISAFGETNRAPFDLPEAESELAAGFHTEYSGMGFALFFLAEYASMVLICALCTALFFGGWKGPFFDGAWWFFLKTYGFLFVMMWVRWTFPRVRFDQLLNLNWQWLLPIGIINLLLTALLIKL